MERVFVYGSLRQGFIRHTALTSPHTKFEGIVTLPNGFLVDLGSYPAYYPSEKGGPVIAESYVITPKTLETLDHIEGHPSYYCREKVTTSTGEGWVYILKPKGGIHRIVDGGDWAVWKHKQAGTVQVAGARAE